MPISLIIPISLYQSGSQYHRVLRYYEDGDGGASEERFKLQVAATLARFVGRHDVCITSSYSYESR